MFKGRALTSLAILGLLTLSLTGCGGKLRMTGKKMCESEGGTYNVEMKHCTYSNQPRSAKQNWPHPKGSRQPTTPPSVQKHSRKPQQTAREIIRF